MIEALKGRTVGNLAANVMTAFEYLRDRFPNARVVDPANSNNIVSTDLSSTAKAAIATAAGTARAAKTWGEIVT